MNALTQMFKLLLGSASFRGRWRDHCHTGELGRQLLAQGSLISVALARDDCFEALWRKHRIGLPSVPNRAGQVLLLLLRRLGPIQQLFGSKTQDVQRSVRYPTLEVSNARRGDALLVLCISIRASLPNHWATNTLRKGGWVMGHELSVLSKLKPSLNRFKKDEDGAALIEYTVLLGILLIAVIAVIVAVGGWISGEWSALNTHL